MKNSIFNAVGKMRYLALLLVLILTCGNAWGAYTYSGTGTFNKQSTIDGDGYYVIILTNSGAMTNSASSNYVGVNTDYNGTSSATISNPKTSVVLQVTNYDSTNKKYYIKNNSGNYLYSSGDKKIAYSATSQYWEIATVNSKARLKTAQATVVHMGYVSGRGFRPYTSSSSNAQSVSAIYKLAAVTPTVTPDPTSLDWGNVLQSSSQSTKTFDISGSNLTGNLSVVVTGGYSVSCGSSISVTSGTPNVTTITVTPPSTSTTGAKNGKVTISGGGLASNVEVNLSMTVNAASTVTWMNNGSEYTTTLVANGSKPEFPSNPSSCDGTSTTFVGWTPTPWSGKLDDVSAKTIYTSGSAMPDVSGPVTYHAVFAKETSTLTPVPNTWTRITSTSQLTDGATVMLVQYESDYAINNTPGATSCTANAEITNSNAALRWIAVKSDSKWKFKTSAGKYLSTSATGNNTALSLNQTYDEWTISADAGGYSNCFNLNNGNDLEYFGGTFKLYTWSSKYSSAYPFYIYIQKTTGSTTYSQYLATCCTSWSDPKFSYNTYSLTAGGAHATKTITGTTHGTLSFESSNTDVITVNSSTGEVTPVGAGTAYVIAHWTEAAGYCAKDLNSNTFTVSGNVTVTFKKNGGTGTDDQTQSVPYNTATALTTLAQVGYTAPSCKEFYGWADSQSKADAGTRDYTDGQSVTLTTGKTLYAVWKDITYTVSDGTMVGVGSHSYSANHITCGTTLTITCAADGDHKGNPTVTATGTHGAITVVSATSVTIANVTSDIAVSISYAEKTNVTATWNAASGSVTGGTTTTQKEGTTFTFPNVTRVDCGTFLGWTNAANSGYNSTSGKPAPFYNVGSTIVLNENTHFYAVYSKVGDDAVAGVLYHHVDTGADLADNDHKGVTVTGTGLDAYKSAPYIKFDGVGDNIIFELDGTPTSFNMQLKTMTGGSSPYNAGLTLYESDSKEGPWIAIGEEVTATGASKAFEINITTAQSFSKRVLKVEMTTRNINVGGGEITINGLRAPINYTTNPGCVDWVLDAINVTTAPTKTTYDECEEFDPTGMVVTATMYEYGNPSNTTTKDVAGYTWTPTQFMTPGNSVAVTISYTEKAVTKTTTTNVRVNDLENYTITFHDGGNTSIWNQSNHCEACDLDSRTGSLACGDYAFAGWSTSNTNYDDQSATITTWVSGSYTPTANTHLYAVYRKGAAPAEFSANCAGGTFTIGTKKGGNTIISRAANTGSFNSYEYGVENSGYTEDQLGKFLFEKVADDTYKISLEREDGYGGGVKRFYVAPDDYSAGSFEFLEEYNAEQCKWKVVAGTCGTWRIYTEFRNTYVTKDYGIVGKGNEALPRFRLVPTGNINGSDNYDVELTPVATPIYQSNPSCSGTYTITFDTHGGTFVQGNYAYPTETTDGLSVPTDSYFPSATMPGCTFVGWKEGSAQEDVTSGLPQGLFEGGAVLLVSSNKTYHAVYYYLDDDWEFDPVEGGTYHMYATDSETKYFCSGTPSKNPGTLTSTTNCASAVDVIITPGTEGNAGKYRINIGGYDITPELNGTGIKQGTFWWNINEVSENLYHITADGAESGRSFNFYKTGKTFTHYKDNGAGIASDISFGRCRQHHWTSDPVLMPRITLGSTGSLNVTSTNGKTVYAANKLTIEATRYGEQTRLYLFSDNPNIGFRKGDGTALSTDGVGPYIQTDASGELATTNITITYTPNVSTDGIETATITVRDNTSPSVQASATRVIKARHLPTDFVITAKWGDQWYALPANCTESTSSTAGVLIEVDNPSDPTRATGAPMNTKYGLQPVRPKRVDDYGSRLVFTEHLSTEKADNQKTLYNGETTSIQVNAMYQYYADANADQYEWIPTTTDLKDYTLTSAKKFDGDAAARTVSLNTSGVFGTLLLAKAYDGKVRLLPATFYEPAEVQILKWKTNSVIVMYTGTDNATTKVGSNPASDPQALNSHKLTQGIYEFTTNQALTANAGQTLRITLGISRLEVEIPLIIAGNTTAAADGKDVVILDGATFTAAGTKRNYRNVYVYGGGKLDIPSGTSLGVNNIILRAGGVTTNGSGGNATYAYTYPQVKLVGTLTSTQTNIKYEYVTDYDHWYHLCLPFNAALSSIQYPQEYYGSNVRAENRGSWVIKRYDGATRATGNYDAWKDIEKDSPAKTEVTAGHGYIFWGAPKKVSVGGGDATRQAWGIQRMTMAITAGDAKTAENAIKNVTDLAAHSNQAGGVNDQGWNLIGNPYMVNLTGLESTSLKQGKLIEEMVNGKWTGRWESNNDGLRYITVPNNNFETYEAVAVAGSGMTLTAGKAFFVQLDGEANAVQFETSKRASLAPAWYRNAEAEQPVDVETGIVISSETLADEVNFWIKDGKTAAYEFNADYPKTPNKTNLNIYGVHQSGNLSWVAISPAIAEGDMAIGYQVPAAGDYTLSLSEKYIAEEIESVFVTDHGVSPELTTDLMVNTYTFTVHQAETNNERFTVSIKVREEDNIATDIGNSTVDTHAVKFIRDDKMYILRNGLLYDATGKRVTEINK